MESVFCRDLIFLTPSRSHGVDEKACVWKRWVGGWMNEYIHEWAG